MAVPPITAQLRATVKRYNKYSSMAMPCPAVEYVKLDAATFDSLCDAIDAIHESLEGENEILMRWRKLDNSYENMQAAGGGR